MWTVDDDILVDPQSSAIGLAQEFIGLPGVIRADRLVYALAFNEHEGGPVLLAGPEYLVDYVGGIVSDSEGDILGFVPIWVDRMPVSRRYIPEHPPGDSSTFGMSFDVVFPRDAGITSGSLAIFTNVATPAASSDFTVGPVQVQGRALYATLTGGTLGTDYQLRWTASGTDGSIATRTALVLCAQTS